MEIEVYADGSATIAAKPGGYGWVIVLDGNKHSEGNGYMEKASNNDAEMNAAIYGLTAALQYVVMVKNMWVAAGGDDWNKPINVTLCSDSQVTLNWANGTYKFKQEAKYKRFEILKELMTRLNAKTRWVRGHSGDPNNERCDELANLGRHRLGPNDKLPSKKKSKKNKNSEKKSKIGKNTENILAVYFQGQIKLVDLSNNICEDYIELVHGPRVLNTEYYDK